MWIERTASPDSAPEVTDSRSAQQKIDDFLETHISTPEGHHLWQEELCLILGKPTSDDGMAAMQKILTMLDLDTKEVLYRKAWAVASSMMAGKTEKKNQELLGQLNYKGANLIIRYCKGPGFENQFKEFLFQYINRRKPLGTKWTKEDFYKFINYIELETLERFGCQPEIATNDEYIECLLITFSLMREQAKADNGSDFNFDRHLVRGTFYGSEQSVYNRFCALGDDLTFGYAALNELCQGREDLNLPEILSISRKEYSERDLHDQLSQMFG